MDPSEFNWQTIEDNIKNIINEFGEKSSKKLVIVGYSSQEYNDDGIKSYFDTDFETVKATFVAWTIFLENTENSTDKYRITFFVKKFLIEHTTKYSSGTICNYWHYVIFRDFSYQDIQHKALEKMEILLVKNEKSVPKNNKNNTPVFFIKCKKFVSDWFVYSCDNSDPLYCSGYFYIRKQYFD